MWLKLFIKFIICIFCAQNWSNFIKVFFLDFIYLFLERGEGKEKKR